MTPEQLHALEDLRRLYSGLGRDLDGLLTQGELRARRLQTEAVVRSLEKGR